MTSSTSPKLEIRPVAGRIGAEIVGVALGPDIEAGVLRALKAALNTYKVLFFRDQTHLDDAQQEAFGALWGEPQAHPTVPVRRGSQYLLELDSEHGGKATAWHTDITFLPAYPRASILRAVVLPEAGGDTVWANTNAAYEALPEPLKRLAEGLRAVHSNAYDYAAVRPNAPPQDVERHRNVFASTVYETEHPVVRVHPETGERHLLLGQFVRRIKGFSGADSQRIYDLLQGYVTRLENTVRWRWRAGDVAMWDNRATQHVAIDDYGPAHRVMRRVTLAGDVPVGLDGQPSRQLSPAPAAAIAAE